MGLFGAIGGALLADLASSAFAAHLGRSNMRTQADLQKELWTYQQSNAHQLEVQDLRNAGLNPILSATNGQVVGQPSVSPDSTGKSDFARAISSVMEASAARNNAEASQNSAKADLLRAQTDKLRLDIDKANSSSNISLNKAQIDKIKADTFNVQLNAKLINQQILSEIQNRFNGIELTRAQVNQLNTASYQMAEMVKVQKQLANAEEDFKHSATEFNKKQVEFFSKKSTKLKDEFDAEYLDSPIGKFFYQFGNGLRTLNPFDGGRVGPFRINGNS